jgi:hypothetical protein
MRHWERQMSNVLSYMWNLDLKNEEHECTIGGLFQSRKGREWKER